MLLTGVKPVIKRCQLALHQEFGNLDYLLYWIAKMVLGVNKKKRKEKTVTQSFARIIIMWT